MTDDQDGILDSDLLADSCGLLAAALGVVGGKWKLLIIQQLLAGTQRFGALRTALPAITQKVLAQSLRELEAEALVLRRAYGGVPPRVEYTLTALGQSLAPVVTALADWGQHYLAQPIGLSRAAASLHPPAPPEALQLPEPLLTPEEVTAAVRAAAALG